MSDLKAHSCEACSPNASKATEEEKQQLHKEVPDWKLTGKNSFIRSTNLKTF